MIYWVYFAVAITAKLVHLSEQKPGLWITSLHTDTQITSRFATTRITSTVLNPSSSPQQAVFRATLPNSAFISNFTMLVDGEVIVGDVDAKAKAQKRFDVAKSKGQTAGLVANKPRETNVFVISVNVAANDKVSFNLTYQEILVRTHGVYKQVVNIDPGQIVPDMKLTVEIRESKSISQLLVPRIEEGVGERTNRELLTLKKNEDVAIERSREGEWHIVKITYELDKAQQEQFSKHGVKGQFVVLYDVDHRNDGGEIQVVNGYFVHFFAPQNLEVGDKSIVFILDKSGSMAGDKIQQLKDAMSVILNDLKEGDVFNIVEFSTNSEEWQKEFVPASVNWKKKAVERIESLEAAGSTDIDSALKSGLQLLKAEDSGKLAKMIVFLTDGLPSAGVVDHFSILKNVAMLNEGKEIHIHAISFGEDADYDLNRKISAQNAGVARKVYIESDTALQLEGFYNEIASPLLSQLSIKYLNETVDPNSIALSDESTIYYEGGEVVVTGRLRNGMFTKDQIRANLAAVVGGFGTGGGMSYDIAVPYCPCFCPWYTYHNHWHGHRRTARHIILPVCDCPDCPIPTPPPAVRDPSPESDSNSFGGFVERMWAYMTIKKLLKRANFEISDTMEQEKLKKKALDLSLKYKFVTELTSLVVTQDNKQNELGEPSSESHDYDDYPGSYVGVPKSSGGGLLSAGGDSFGDMDDLVDFEEKEVDEPAEAYETEMYEITEIYVTTESYSTFQPTTNPPTVGTPAPPAWTFPIVPPSADVRYVLADIGSFNRTSFVKVSQQTLHKCALECVDTPGCTMAVFYPPVRRTSESCLLSFQKALPCSGQKLITLNKMPTSVTVVHCIEKIMH